MDKFLVYIHNSTVSEKAINELRKCPGWLVADTVIYNLVDAGIPKGWDNVVIELDSDEDCRQLQEYCNNSAEDFCEDDIYSFEAAHLYVILMRHHDVNINPKEDFASYIADFGKDERAIVAGGILSLKTCIKESSELENNPTYKRFHSIIKQLEEWLKFHGYDNVLNYALSPHIVEGRVYDIPYFDEPEQKNQQTWRECILFEKMISLEYQINELRKRLNGLS